jgi:hypothetical protein
MLRHEHFGTPPTVAPSRTLLALVLVLAAPACARAQRIPLSQQASVRQKVANTWIEVRYRRPIARGRTLFGDLVPWNRIWTPSADSATTITISTPVRIENDTLPAGSYSIWMIPDSAAHWTVVFNRTAAAFHLDYPGERNDQLRVHVTAWQGPHMETLLWYFPVVNGADATLVMHWGTTGVPLMIKAPTREQDLPR